MAWSLVLSLRLPPGPASGELVSGPSRQQETRKISRNEEVTVDLSGKKVIALGDRDSVPGEAIAAVAESLGGVVIAVRTECFV